MQLIESGLNASLEVALGARPDLVAGDVDQIDEIHHSFVVREISRGDDALTDRDLRACVELQQLDFVVGIDRQRVDEVLGHFRLFRADRGHEKRFCELSESNANDVEDR